jgi:hypothetical protein
MALTPKQRKAALEKGFTVNLASSDDAKYLSPNPRAATQLFTKAAGEDKASASLPADGLSLLPADRLPRLPADRQYYRQTVSRFAGSDIRSAGSEIDSENPSLLPADPLPVANEVLTASIDEGIPLAPVQWSLWEALCEADATDQIVSYRKFALRLNASIRGVRDAMTVIEKEGGVIAKFTIRTPDEQGMRITVKRDHPFRKSSLKETKALLKRENDYRQTVNRQSPTLPADGLRLSVCISEYIKQTDIGDLLSLFPPTWNVRERTLTEVARTYPHMTLIEFRRSITHLVDQAAKSKTQIQNHNAWLKAAFAKNEGPLVTERMIEAQLDHVTAKPKEQVTTTGSRKDTVARDLQAEVAALRMYVAASAEERAVLDARAQEKAAAAFRMTPADKHSEILEQALIEVSREHFFARSVKALDKRDSTTG